MLVGGNGRGIELSNFPEVAPFLTNSGRDVSAVEGHLGQALQIASAAS